MSGPLVFNMNFDNWPRPGLFLACCMLVRGLTRQFLPPSRYPAGDYILLII
jgi:hypothetical protein